MTEPAVDFGGLAQRGYRFALSLTHDSALAEDLVQDVWLSVLTAGGPWKINYVIAAIRNRYIDQYRRQKRIAFVSLDDERIEEIDGPGGRDDELCVDVSREAFYEALGALTAEERSALYLAGVEDYSVQQIADLFERPRGTMLSMMHRARRKVRQSIASESRLRA